MEQRLAAVLAADMAGYSRLMEADERGTLARLRTHRIELIDPSIAKNNGRIIKTTGDGMLVEFHSVADAVGCAVEVQQRMSRRNSDVPEDKRIQFRVGINLGDIIFDGGDIYGDGVNVAARLEQIADVGGVYVSGAVYHQIAGRMELAFEEVGEKILKNLKRPVQVYRVVLDANGVAATVGEKGAAVEPVAAVRPSIAVLPFVNFSGDPEQEFFADGLTEDILTELSRHHGLFVISRNSTFVYKGQSVNVRDLAQTLGARYVVEGSVRRAGDRVRVTAQLIDASNDAHIWAERYDRNIDDLFALQDELTSAIVATLPGRIEAAQHDLLARKTPSSLAAYECVLEAKVLHHRSTRDDNAAAQKLAARAVALDPGYAHAHAWRACILGQAWGYGWLEEPEAAYELAVESIRQAAALDDNDADVHRLLAALHILENEMDRALTHQERALALNPNYDLVVVQMGELLTWMGQAEEGVEWIMKAMRLNPHHPARFWSHLGRAYFTSRDYEKAISAFLRMSDLDIPQLTFIAACHMGLGQMDQAERYAEKVREKDPGFEIEPFMSTLHYAQETDKQHLRDGLLAAGLT